MDVRSWKKVLLQWISECGFIELNFFNIEQSDIDEFFKQFCKRHARAGCRDVEAGTTSEYKNGVIGFLQENYPDFQPHTDDTNALSPADYLYVYSLLLHYSCVKYPDTFFHEKCQKLSEHAQQCIAWFFNQLLDCEKTDKESLRRAIADIATTQISPRHNDNFSSSSNGIPSPKFIPPVSPVKTPRKSSAPTQRISPSTPKSFLLEERTRELYTLRAQLETERYEKGLLEVQIKQYEDKMGKLNQDHKKLKQQIQDLKSDLLNRNTEMSSSRNGDEHIKRRLCKEISQKEQEISKLTDIISTLTEEKSLAQEKLAVAERQILACMERLKELDYRIDDLTKELEKKSNTIKYLSDNNAELEHYISEIRSQSTSSGRPDFNTSLDSSNSLSSPENLGCSVIDLQLREKENENYQLREELQKLKQTNSRLAIHIQKLSMQYVQEFQIDIQHFSEIQDEFVDPAEHFIVFATCMDKVCKSYKDERNRAKKLQEDVCILKERNEELSRNVDDLSENVLKLKGVLERLEKSNCDVEMAKNQLQEKLSQCNDDISLLNQQKIELTGKLNLLTSEYDIHWINCEAHASQQAREIDSLKTQLDEQKRKLSEKYDQNLQLNEEIESLRMKVQSAQEKLMFKTSDFEMEVKTLNEKLQNQKSEIEAHEITEKMVKEKYEELLITYEKMRRDARDTDAYLTTMRTELASKEEEMDRLGNEIISVCKKNTELEGRINDLVSEYKNTKQSSDMTINKRDERIKEIEAELTTANETIDSIKIELRDAQCGYERSKTDLHNVSIKVRELTQFFNLTATGDDSLSPSIANISAKVKEVVEQKVNLIQQIEVLEFSNVEKQTKLDVIQEELQKVWKEKQAVVEELGSALQAKDKELHDYYEKLEIEKYDFENKLKEKQDSNDKDKRKLCLLTEEHEAIKRKLSESEEQLQKERTENGLSATVKLKDYEEKLDKLNVNNTKLIDDLNMLRKEHLMNECKLKEADIVLSKLAIKIDKENESQSEINEKFPLREVQLEETELKINAIMQERVSDVGDTQKVHELPMEKLKQDDENVVVLEKIQKDQTDLISNLKTNLEEFVAEKERMIKDSETIRSQLEFERREKVVLLCSLETTSERLKELLDEKVTTTNALENKCLELHNKLHKADKHITTLESNLVEQETELRIALDEYQQECDKWKSKFSEAMHKVSNKSLEIEAFETAMVELLTILEDNFNYLGETDLQDVKDYFNHSDEKGYTQHNFLALKKILNQLLFTLAKLNTKVDQAEQAHKEATDYVEVLIKTNNDMIAHNNHLKTELLEVQKLVTAEAKALESDKSVEIKRITENIHNLENINQVLTTDNARLQCKVTSLEEKVANFQLSINMLTEKEKSLTCDLEFKDEIMGKMKEEERKQMEKRSNFDILQEKCVALDKQLKDRTAVFEKELKELQNKLIEQEQKCASMEIEFKHKLMENTALQSKSNEYLNISKQFDEQMKVMVGKREDAEAEILEMEKKYEKLNTQYEQLNQDFEEYKLQCESTYCDVVRLTSELESLKMENLKMQDDARETKRELLRGKENNSQLIQQNGSIRLEKASLTDENRLLKQELERVAAYRIAADIKIKDITDQTKMLECKLTDAEKKLGAIRATVDISGDSTVKLNMENTKLRETQETTTKRIESLAFKLGELQARYAKTERDNEKLTKSLEVNIAKIECLQKEKQFLQKDNDNLRKDKEVMQTETKTLKDHLNRAEQAATELSIKIQLLEGAKEALEEAKQTLEASEIDNKSKIFKLEKIRDSNEEKIRMLRQDLERNEQTIVRLNFKISTLNSQVQNSNQSEEFRNKIEEVTTSYNAAKDQMKTYENAIEKLQAHIVELEQQNKSVSEQLSEVSESFQESKEKCDLLLYDMEQLRTDIRTLMAEKSKIEEDHKGTCAKLLNFEMLNKQIKIERDELVGSLKDTIAELKNCVEAKNFEIVNLQQEIDILRKSVENKSASIAEMEELRMRLNVLTETVEKEQQVTTQLRLDNQILQAKYREAKQRIMDETSAGEDRIKENRLEMEGKLEKMKNKMKTLYNEEINKMKSKQERETAHLKSELDVLKAQNIKYEEHVRKLSNQIGRLNDRNLDYQKENAILATKLKHLEEHTQPFKRPSSLHVRTVSAKSASTAPTSLDTNFGMEDEEGEVFNNTYLTDLKCGHMSDLMSKNVCPEELQYRNSLLPPHLKSTYAAQYDHGLPEDELKDGPHSLDDSMLALISTTGPSAGGPRKKVSGATHYKRPGPPTPSKHGGRLSFGGNTEPTRAILKEVRDDDNTESISASKTPARFSFFASRFSMGNIKDEEQPSCSNNLRKVFQMKNFRWIQMADEGAVCTSTPRTSKTNFDQRRLLDQMSQSSPSASDRDLPVPVVKTENRLKKRICMETRFPCALSSNNLSPRVAVGVHQRRRAHHVVLSKRRMSRRLRESLAAESCSLAEEETPDEVAQMLLPRSSDTDSTSQSERRLRKRAKRERGSRPSINLCGNMFVKNRQMPKRALVRDLQRNMRRKHRLNDFNRLRNIQTQKEDEGSTALTPKSSDTFDMEDTADHSNHNVLPLNTMAMVAVVKTKYLQDAHDEYEQREEQSGDEEYCDETYTEDMEVGMDVEPGDCVDISDDNDGGYRIDHVPNTIAELGPDEPQADKNKGNNMQHEDRVEECSLNSEDNTEEQGQHFEQLLRITRSHAPFDVRRRKFSPIASNVSIGSTAHTAASTTAVASVTSTTVTSQSSLTHSENLSRTIYGASIIFNRRIPNINTLQVRKSSIYIRNQESNATNEIVLVTDQTINIIDLMRMWKQMSAMARFFLAFSAATTIASMAWLVVFFIRS